MEDPRRTNGGHILHKLEDIIIIGLCTVVCGGEDFPDMKEFGKEREEWLRKFLELGGISFSEMNKRHCPNYSSIGCFGRITDVTNKTVDELKELRALGYNGLTFGVETDDNEALAFMNKGFRASDVLELCKKLEAAGISYNFFYLTGISGAGWGEIGAKASAELFNQLQPQIIESSMFCTHTRYNMVWDGLLSIKVTELPEALKRKGRKSKGRENKKCYGTSISDRPEIAAQCMEEGHWEGGTVVGKRAGHETVVLTLLEKKTENYLAIRIPGKTSKAVMDAMSTLRAEYGQHFPQVFKTITVDNGSEFADFAQTEAWGSKVFFAHPYTSWECAQNERHNGLFRSFVRLH